MRHENKAFERVGRTPNADETTNSIGVNSDSFVPNSTRPCRTKQAVLCHRCGHIRPRRGSMAADIAAPRGNSKRHYLCPQCIRDLQGA